MGIKSNDELDRVVQGISDLTNNVELLETTMKRIADILDSGLNDFAESLEGLNENIVELGEAIGTAASLMQSQLPGDNDDE